MDRFEVADVLEEIASHLEFRGENPFKTRAFQNGARVVRELPEDLDARAPRRSQGLDAWPLPRLLEHLARRREKRT